ncbi:dockerin type I domain-containing protein [Candidatus Methanomassiliicoccus intestinalis]|jgi:ABC transporter, substrate-binding protein|uniref:dockerin type I domain-containing protein n=2 Tax=Candidatus Methanomassiliicoccus intestinalis TaxID=1406512 RepID=UPI0037DCB1EF
MNNKIIAALVALIIVVAGVGAYCIISGNDEGEDKHLLADDYALQIYGNANGDWAVDEKDIEYLKKIISGDEEKTEFADANNDGTIDQKDIDKVQGIINRTTDSMYMLDGSGKKIKTTLDPQRIAADYLPNAELLNILEISDRVVAVDKAPYDLREFYYMNHPDKDSIVCFGANNGANLNVEVVADAKADVWLTFTTANYDDKVNAIPNGNVVYLGLNKADITDPYRSTSIQGFLKAGYIFDKVERAEDYVEWLLDIYENINGVTENISDDQKPYAYFLWYGHYVTGATNDIRGFAKSDPLSQACMLAGGRCITELNENIWLHSSDYMQIDPEWVADHADLIDYVFAHSVKISGNGSMNAEVPNNGYLCDDPSEFEDAQKHMATVDIFSGIDPNNMYCISGDFRNNGTGSMLLAVYLAKLFHPDLFPDLDPVAIHQTYISEWLGFQNYDLSKQGVFFLME